MKNQSLTRWLTQPVWVLGFLAILCVLPALAYASGVNPVLDGLCTDTGVFDLNMPAPGTGLISTIITNIQNILNAIAEQVFKGVVSDQGFIKYIRGMLTLYFCIYGILFALGIAQPTLYDFVIRMIKVATVALLVSGNSWAVFNQYVVPFLNQGTDDLINMVTTVAVGGESYTGPTMQSSGNFYRVPPFYVIDNAVAVGTSARMTATLAAIFTTGPYGIIYGLFLTVALGSFMKSLLFALWVYLMSLVMKTLLFGLAPIFLSFLLFSHTRHLFDGWVNQLVNASLQPLLLFIFFAFFSMMIQACLIGVISQPVCWTEMNESIRGTPFSEHFWRFKKNGQMFSGIWDFKDNFPIDIMTLLFFMILADLCGKFNEMIIKIAADLAGAATNLSFPGPRGTVVDALFSSSRGGGKAKGRAGGDRGGVGAGGAGAGGGGRAGGARSGPGLDAPESDTPLADLRRLTRDSVSEAARRASPKVGGR